MKEEKEMTKLFTSISRVLVVALCVVAFGAADVSNTQAQSAGQSNPAPKKKKLPAGARGFEQFANRDASDKLVTGGATRGECKTYEQLIDCGSGSYELGEYKQAVQSFTQAATMKPEMFLPQYYLGYAYEALGQFKEAAAAYKRATTLKLDDETDSPSNVLIAYYHLGNAYAETGQHKDAIEAYRHVVKLMPTLAKPYYNLALSYAADGQQPEAINAFKEAIKLNPDYWEAYYNMGVAYSKSEQYPEAVEAFKKTLSLNPDYTSAHYNLGVAYYFLDDRKLLAEEQKALETKKPELAKELAKLIGN